MREQIRAWTETFETFILDVIFEQRRGKRAALTRGLLYCLTKLFSKLSGWAIPLSDATFLPWR